MTESVQQGTVADLRNNGKTKFYTIMISVSYRHSECFVFESRTCNRSCVLHNRGAVLEKNRQIAVILFQKETSDMYHLESIDFFVCSSRF